ncbi:hypothetical protein KCP77_06670 [Salmonella enterica subsp. enterica]|nr:hypothetical protein KCP77_06670 [Salmonella enterica subsp. enterica]
MRTTASGWFTGEGWVNFRPYILLTAIGRFLMNRQPALPALRLSPRHFYLTSLSVVSRRNRKCGEDNKPSEVMKCDRSRIM